VKRKRPRLSKLSCIYCGGPAGTKDHVPPKLLLEKPFPPNLKTVPSCQACNQGASLDEQYFLALIGHVSPAEAIARKLEPGGVLDRALELSPALEDRLLDALHVDEETGLPVIRLETERVERILKKIALGLFALRYGRIPSLESIGAVNLYPYEPRDARPLAYFTATFTESFRPKRWTTVQPDVFSYIFVRDPRPGRKVWCIVDIHRSLWGAVHFPDPQAVGAIDLQQPWLFPGLGP
jgi:hypothetical protein